MKLVRIALYSALAAALLCAPSGAAADGPDDAPAQLAQAQNGAKSIPAGGDRTLVIPPAAIAAPASNGEAAPAPPQSAPPPGVGSDNAPLPYDTAAPPRHGPLPYLGVSVMYTVSMRGGQQVSGLKVMSVDQNSPAARAGLKTGTPMTTIGASGTTAAQLLGPLDAAVRPLLAKSGQLGKDGDLIVAIDDHRVISDSDLPDRLAQLHPGDIIYLTVLRQRSDGSYKAIKLPVTLGFPRSAGTRESSR